MLVTPALALASIAAASPVTIFNPNCTTQDPYKCVNAGGCGWCGASFTCMPGDSSGPVALPCARHGKFDDPGHPWVGFWATSVHELRESAARHTRVPAERIALALGDFILSDECSAEELGLFGRAKELRVSVGMPG